MQSSEIKNKIIQSLKKRKQNILNQWGNPIGTETKHFYIDNFLPDFYAIKIFNSFPQDGKGFILQKSFRENKLTLAQFHKLESGSKYIFEQITTAFQLPDVINEIGKILDIPKLEGDPQLYAGGVSIMNKGNFLNPHIDNSHDAFRKKYRRLNVLYYVSPDWGYENGGNLELWDNKVRIPKTIISKFNRLVVMETNKRSFHSVSPVLTNIPRCCISNYYFNSESPDGKKYFHVTSFTGRPDQKSKRFFCKIDNFVRNVISKSLKIGRGKNQMKT